jgi:hypothetical protein
VRGRSDTDADVDGAEGVPAVFRWPEKPVGGILNVRWIPEKPDHGKLFTTFRYQLFDSFSLGMDYRPLTNDAGIAANWRVFSENDKWLPALILGTSNDDFGDITSQSYYGTFSKHLFEWEGINFSPYVGATYIAELEDLRPVGGLHVRRGDWSALVTYSGVDTHLSLSRDIGNHTLSFILFDLELPGMAWSFRF